MISIKDVKFNLKNDDSMPILHVNDNLNVSMIDKLDIEKG